MDKRVIFAVAGSGKTTYIIKQLSLDKRSLIITYTQNNVINLKNSIINKFGFLPDNITLLPYFTFLYSFCFRPFLSFKIKCKGMFWEQPPRWTIQVKRSDIQFYRTENYLLYHNRIAKLLDVYNVIADIKLRLEKYFDNLFIDEIQDFAGNDFNFLKKIVTANINILFVGDFYQHTFDTSRDGTTNRTLYSNFRNYQSAFRSMGLLVNNETLKNSYRCSISICNFISQKLGIEIESNKTDDSEVSYIDNQESAEEIFKNNEIVKLFYNEHQKYNCYSRNWGSSKGENHFNDVCVVLNATTLVKYKNDKLNELVPQTKNKFYVACSRANNNLYFVSHEFYRKYKE